MPVILAGTRVDIVRGSLRRRERYRVIHYRHLDGVNAVSLLQDKPKLTLRYFSIRNLVFVLRPVPSSFAASQTWTILFNTAPVHIQLARLPKVFMALVMAPGDFIIGQVSGVQQD